MIVYGLTEDEAKTVVLAVSSMRYNDNVIVKHSRVLAKHTCSISLRVKDSRAHGARYGRSGRHTSAASWEVFRDVIEALFVLGAKKIVTQIETYKSLQDYYDKFPATYHHNIGGQIYPVSLGECSV